jgi:nitrate/TMAO reductase-like tetraheme cytochrome c subunit
MSRRLKIVIQLGIVLVIAGAIGAAGFIQYSAQPSFCLNCHIMIPYYDSWESSSHNDVPCIACHYAPGIKAEAMGKLQAANQVVKYVTGQYGMRPWAEIDDAACLRSGCHSERKLEGLADYRGVAFDHTNHLGELRYGKQLRCTSCHSQLVQGDHIAVTATTCYLCHFKEEGSADPVSGCIGCHPSPAKTTSPAGFVVDHPQYVEDLVSCVSCHEEVVLGTGDAEEARCLNCHGDEERLREFDDTEKMHRVHITEHKVECTQCHAPIAHEVVELAPATFELECGSCHRGAHEAQKQLYAGVGGHATDSLPSVMFTARVSCTGCHELLQDVPGHGEVQSAGEASCLSCHGITYANILPAWQSEMERRQARVDPVVRDARRSLSSVPLRRRAAADSLLSLASENLELVRIGRGAHNIAYSDRLLRGALDLTREAVRVGGLPYTVPDVDLGPPVSENICLACHLGAERRESVFQGKAFSHSSHSLMAGLECSECHTPLEEHGGTTLASAASCDGCHHPAIGVQNCAACHEGPGGAPEAVYALEEGDFSHDVHGPVNDLDCGDCHSGSRMATTDVECQSCHVEHHRPETGCLSCHRGGANEDHELADHVACVQCHEPLADQLDHWTRQICLSCHADLGEHHEPKACEACHRVPPMGSIREAVPTTETPDSLASSN